MIAPEWEVLPPEEKDKRARLEPLFRCVAVVMDELITFPNTKFKFGLDPVIGLVPGIGDTDQRDRWDHSGFGRRVFLLVQIE